LFLACSQIGQRLPRGTSRSRCPGGDRPRTRGRPVREPKLVDRGHRHPTGDLKRLDGGPDHDHEHPDDQETRPDQHFLVRQLLLERDREHPDDSGRGCAHRDAGEHRQRPRLENDCLDEEHGLEPFPVDAGEPQGDKAQGRSEPTYPEHPLLPTVQVGEMLVPVHAVVDQLSTSSRTPIAISETTASKRSP
jgi:hypothetical protein